jgi:hypothetical protein
MNDRTNNGGNDPLKDLFGRKKDAGMDDFDRDALEGFDMLNSEDDAFELRKKLDARVGNEVFGKKEKNRKAVYWMAAAALLLIVGSAVFVLKENDRGEETKLAIHKTEDKKEEPQKSEPVAVEKDPQTVPEKTQEEPGSVEKRSNGSVTKPFSQPASHDAKNEGAGGPALAAAKDKKAENAGEEVTRSEESEMDLSAAPEKDDKQMEEQVKVAVTAPVITSKNTYNMASSGAASHEWSSPAPSMATPNTMSTNSVAATVEHKAKIERSRKKAAFAEAQIKPSTSCYYRDGEKSLKKLLASKLVAKDINGGFAAKLTVNKNGKVEKVEFIKTKDLTDNQKKQIVAVLLSLDGFVVNDNAGNDVPAEYTLNFEP